MQTTAENSNRQESALTAEDHGYIEIFPRQIVMGQARFNEESSAWDIKEVPDSKSLSGKKRVSIMTLRLTHENFESESLVIGLLRDLLGEKYIPLEFQEQVINALERNDPLPSLDIEMDPSVLAKIRQKIQNQSRRDLKDGIYPGAKAALQELSTGEWSGIKGIERR